MLSRANRAERKSYEPSVLKHFQGRGAAGEGTAAKRYSATQRWVVVTPAVRRATTKARAPPKTRGPARESKAKSNNALYVHQRVYCRVLKPP